MALRLLILLISSVRAYGNCTKRIIMKPQPYKRRRADDIPIAKPSEPLPDIFERWSGSEDPTLRRSKRNASAKRYVVVRWPVRSREN